MCLGEDAKRTVPIGKPPGFRHLVGGHFQWCYVGKSSGRWGVEIRMVFERGTDMFAT